MRCVECEYDLSGLPADGKGLTCPECGHFNNGEAEITPWHRSWVVPLLLAVVLWSVIAVWTFVRAQESKWAVVGMVIFFVPIAGAINGIVSWISWRRTHASPALGLVVAIGTALVGAIVALIAGDLANGSRC